jgi:teichoic acid transport system permease protein
MSDTTEQSTSSRLRSSDDSQSLRAYVRSAWRRRHFAYAMPAERLRSRHQNTVLGNVWNLLNPMLTAGVYFLIFGVILNASRGIDNYILWLVIGLFAFRLTNATVAQGATSITSRQGLVRSLRFPRILLPVSTTIGELLTFAFEIVILFVFAFATGEGISWKIVFLPAVIALHTVFNLGLALIVARLNDAFRDIQQLIPFVFMILRYLTGVMIPIARFEESAPIAIYYVISWNPLVQILDLYRWVFMGSEVHLTWFDLAHAVGVSILVLLIGIKFFAGAEHRYGRP